MFRTLAVTLIVLALSAAPALADTGQGSISGKVLRVIDNRMPVACAVDPCPAREIAPLPAPGVTVAAFNALDKSKSFSATTDRAGRYTLSDLPRGRYVVFALSLKKKLSVRGNRASRLNFTEVVSVN